MNPFISIIIPTYNHAHFLKKSLQSVLDQKYDNWEAIVIDNHSTDATDKVVFGFNDNRIKLLKINNNGIIARSRNLGIKEAKGNWIAFLDSDDLWYPTRLSLVLTILESENKYDVVCTDELMVDIETGNTKILKHCPYVKEFYKTMLLYGNRLSTSATLVRRSFLNKYELLFPEERDFVTVEDYGLWLKLALNKAKFKFIHSTEGEYTIHGNNCSQDLALHYQNLYRLLKYHASILANIKKYKNIGSRLSLIKARRLLASKELYLAIVEMLSIDFIWLIKFSLLKLNIVKQTLELYQGFSPLKKIIPQEYGNKK